MRDYVQDVPEREFGLPVVLLVGTSMSAGKTTSAKVIVRLLREAGLAVVGAKLTGAGRYRDILAMQDAGAEHIFDFVDAGLPSTVVSGERVPAGLAPPPLAHSRRRRRRARGGGGRLAPGTLQRGGGNRGDRAERTLHRALRLGPLRRDRRDQQPSATAPTS